jgi:hypothetical protein
MVRGVALDISRALGPLDKPRYVSYCAAWRPIRPNISRSHGIFCNTMQCVHSAGRFHRVGRDLPATARLHCMLIFLQERGYALQTWVGSSYEVSRSPPILTYRSGSIYTQPVVSHEYSPCLSIGTSYLAHHVGSSVCRSILKHNHHVRGI